MDRCHPLHIQSCHKPHSISWSPCLLTFTSVRQHKHVRDYGPKHRRCLQCQAAKGFGQSNSKAAKRAQQKLLQRPAVEPLSDEWFKVATLSSIQNGAKSTKAAFLPGGDALVLYWIAETGKLYCTDAYSTAYKYPLVDGKVFMKDGVPHVETPLDGTVYNLENGKVVDWVPKNNPVRAVLGTLKVGTLNLGTLQVSLKPGTVKASTDPVKLPTFPVQVVGDDVYVKP